jgi:hypothetical protein
MGGMIAQTLAIEYPSRIRSLTSIMSSTGDTALPDPSPEAMAVLMTPSAEIREAFSEQHLASNRAVGADPAFFPYEEERLRARAARLWDYGIDREGSTRQMLSSLASGDRTPALRQLSLPALVIHGSADTLFSSEHAEATAQAIPGAQRLIIEGFGHDMHHRQRDCHALRGRLESIAWARLSSSHLLYSRHSYAHPSASSSRMLFAGSPPPPFREILYGLRDSERSKCPRGQGQPASALGAQGHDAHACGPASHDRGPTLQHSHG